ncbi:MAG: hypothetical protein LBE91_14970 [Tannerella sp.]|jgi:hypothetical protein|nr:hypothetical protein [Tannerella sp.]
MKQNILKISLYALSLACLPVAAQNMLSIEAPTGISLVYGLDYHPVWYTQIKPTFGFAWTRVDFLGESSELQYALIVEQRYYYNMLKRQSKGKNTLNKSANFFSIKSGYILSRVDSYDLFTQITGIDKYNTHTYYGTVNWGLRRAMGKRFYFDGSIGLGPTYLTYNKKWDVMFDLTVNIGFKLF